MDINQNNINDAENNLTTNYLKDVDSELSGKLRPLNPNSAIREKLTFKTKLFYSMGHIYNDLTVSIWFSYTLLYFKFQFTDSMAGSLLLIGQVADAIASPFVGFESDKSPNIWICKYGRRKTWHLLGVLMNTISVPILYNVPCFPANCEGSSMWARFIYYSVLIVIFQAGWAATQVNISFIYKLIKHIYLYIFLICSLFCFLILL